MARRTQEEIGNRKVADNYFYREMEEKIRQKPWYIKYPGLLFQYIFGYGVKPF